jgi:hypothetical protein
VTDVIFRNSLHIFVSQRRCISALRSGEIEAVLFSVFLQQQ